MHLAVLILILEYIRKQILFLFTINAEKHWKNVSQLL